MISVLIVILCVATVEACSWAYSLYTHCSWAVRNSIQDKRVFIPYSVLAVFSSLSGLMSLIVWCVYIFIITLNVLIPTCIITLFFIVLFFQIMTIHSWYIVSMYVCVPFEYIPFISRHIILMMNKILREKNRIKYISLDQWYDIFSPTKDRNLIVNFLDVIPELIWTKDKDNKFTYVNNAICKKLLLGEKEDVIGKTSSMIAEEQRKMGRIYTFGELCCDSDEITKNRRKMSLFYEYGLVNNKFLSLRVLKCPIYDTDSNIVGVIGAARDITFHTSAHNRIGALIETGDMDKALSEFVLYKEKFDSFREYKDLDTFIRDIEINEGQETNGNQNN